MNIKGSLGRGAANGVPAATVRSISGTLDTVGGNAYSAGNALAGGFTIMEFADDFVDHTGLDFIGGAYPFGIGGYLGGGPGNFNLYANGPDTTMMGSAFKASLKDTFLPQKLTINIAPYGMWPPTTDWFIDIDPHYTDAYGDPVARMTLDYGLNTFKCANYFAPKYADILTKMGATNVTVSDPVSGEDQHMFTFPAHIRGDARLERIQPSPS